MKPRYSFLLPLLYISPAVADYTENTHTAIQLLQDKFYNVDTGLWKGATGDLWWQSGHILETVARFGIADESYKQTAIDIVANTYAKSGDQIGYTNWHNDYYDDMGWWAQGWIAAYDLTGDSKYLDTAKDLFEDMTGGYHTPCGGIFWSKAATGIASISNELFLSVAAHLANRVGDGEKENYKNWAHQEWDFIWNSGVINGDNLINDGVDMGTCKNNGKPIYTYNQGVVLAGLSELAKAFSDGGFIDHAYTLARASLSKLTTNSILAEPFPSPLDEQGSMFKGAFIAGLLTLHANEPQADFAAFFKTNADSVWEKARNGDGVIEDLFDGSGNANAASHASGIDVLLAASRS
ncbi:glycosyl hydrolase [Paraphaeosphaeria sporulosa]|uniref:Glycosyl hydrolase n=1 Tax=Paraphaeosphaeria sporulosa TaxID=1460663 RepID=A0A177CHF0_9PLEO|nr:glycosyl hydrolase [Paraphaeosphaeria sporulosa]OAG06994.1 glycosyl hydrolase [Paraphaeosphaeria sporulosa]